MCGFMGGLLCGVGGLLCCMCGYDLFLIWGNFGYLNELIRGL